MLTIQVKLRSKAISCPRMGVDLEAGRNPAAAHQRRRGFDIAVASQMKSAGWSRPGSR